MKQLKDLRVIGVPWHTAHQYELAKLFGSYDMLINHYRVWGDVSRNRPGNMFDTLTVDPKKYDLAILHVDQQCIHPKFDKHLLFKDFELVTRGIPRVVINHMTPYDDLLETPEVKKRMRKLVGDIPMITNSRQAADQWGWGYPIIHGMDVNQWKNNPKEPRIAVSLSTGGMERAYRRELLYQTMELLESRGLRLYWIQSDLRFKTFEEYHDFLSRTLVYFNPTWQSPMPRSRTEAMLCGACIVSTRHHDWSDYITDGHNGFIIKDNPKSAADLLYDLVMNRPDEARVIGERGRETARANFDSTAFYQQWHKFLTDIGVLQ